MILSAACRARHQAGRATQSSNRTASPVERARVLSAAISRAGGDGVWVKPPFRVERRLRTADERGVLLSEVLAEPSAYPRAIAALEREAARQGLNLMRPPPAESGSREDEFQIVDGKGVPAAAWRFREVRRLLRASIIIDDLGGSLETARRVFSLPHPVALSILPGLRASSETALEARRLHRDVLLHLPMQALSGAAAGPGAIQPGMSQSQVSRIVQRDLASVPEARGVNNHMGSSATADSALMQEVMRVLARRHLYFIDSRTTSDTVALEAARKQGVAAFYRSVFLDDVETVSYTRNQIRALCRLVRRQGAAVAIGHPHPSTLIALARSLPQFEELDIELVPPSTLVRLPEVVRLWPARPQGYQEKGR